MKKRLTFSILGVIALAVALVPHWTVSADKPVAVIVYKQAFLSQSGTLASTTLVTPLADGDYRLSIILSSNDSSIAPTLTWTDENGAQSTSMNINQQNTLYTKQLTYLFHAVSGHAIAISESGAATHDLFVTLEEL